MSLDRLGMRRAEEPGRTAVAVREAGSGELFVLIVLPEVGPHLECDGAGRNGFRIAAPMPPALMGGVVRAPEPSLIAAQDFVMKRRGVDGWRLRRRLVALN